MKNSALIYSLAFTFSLFTACSNKTDQTSTDEEVAATEASFDLSTKQFQSSDMKLGKLEKTEFHDIVKATGTIDVPPEYRAEVSSYFGGTVKSIKLLTGQKVKKGEVLFTLENPEYVQIQQDFLEAKGQLAYLKSDYERQKNLSEDNVSSKKNFLKAESEYTVTKVKEQSLRKKLMLMNINPNNLTLDNIRTTINILSPIGGYVTEVVISQGSFLTPSQLAVGIVNTDHLHIELNVFEKDIARVKKDQTILFRTQDNMNEEFKAIVHLVNKTIDHEKRTVGIHAHLVDEEKTVMLNPGMYVEADIYTTSESKLSLPNDAIVEFEGKYYALALKNSSDNGYIFVKREIKPGAKDSERTEVLNSNDFSENTKFLVKGAFNLITD